MNANKLVISLEGNDALKEYLAKKTPGDVCEFEVEASMDEQTPTQAVFSVKNVEAYSDNEESEQPEPDEPTSEEPSMGEDEAAGPKMGKGPAAVMIAFAKKKA